MTKLELEDIKCLYIYRCPVIMKIDENIGLNGTGNCWNYLQTDYTWKHKVFSVLLVKNRREFLQTIKKIDKIKKFRPGEINRLFPCYKDRNDFFYSLR
jgi:hypothetical protein